MRLLEPLSELTDQELAQRLDRWAKARERRNGPDGYGLTGTMLLQLAAERLSEKPMFRQWMSEDNLTGIELDAEELTIRTREKEHFMWGPPETCREVTAK